MSYILILLVAYGQDVARLHEAVAAMDSKEAKKWMKMCVDSGLWCPADKDEFERPDDEEGEGEGEGEGEVADGAEGDANAQVEELS